MKIERRALLKGALAGAAGTLLFGGCGNSRQRTTCNRNIGDAHKRGVSSLAIDPGGTLLASGGSDALIKLWRLPDGALLSTLTGHTQDVVALAISPDGTLLASGSADSTVKLWSLADGSLLGTLAGHTLPVAGLAFAPDGQLLASGSADATVKLWNIVDGSLLATLLGHTLAVTDVAAEEPLPTSPRVPTLPCWFRRAKTRP